MSQLYSKKEPSHFQPELDANKLVAYTTHILVNRNYFPEELQQTIVPKIVDIVLEMAEKVNEANSINVKPSLNKEELLEGYRKRIELQSEALRLLNVLKQRIKILKVGYHLAGHKARSWNNNVNETIASLTQWRRGEVKKFKELGGTL